MKHLSLMAVLALAACAGQTPDQKAAEVSAGVQIAASALPCALAIKSATGASNTLANAANGSAALAMNPACAGVDAGTVGLIQTAVTSGQNIHSTASVSAGGAPVAAAVTIPGAASATAVQAVPTR